MSRGFLMWAQILAWSQAFAMGYFVAAGEPLWVAFHGALWGMLTWIIRRERAKAVR